MLAQFEQLVWRAARSPGAVAIAAIVLLVLVFLVGVVSGSPREPALVAYAVPVALLALALGARAGAASALAASVLYWLAAYVDDHAFSFGEISYRAASLVFLGGVVGMLSTRLGEAEHSAHLQRELRSRAAELNDTVVQGLALARYLLDRGDAAAAAATLNSTLERAKELVADLMGDVELEPGALRRESAADVGASRSS